MSAPALTLPATVLLNRNAGTWLVHALWLALVVGAVLVDPHRTNAHILRLVVSGAGISFWWLLMSGHLLGTVWQMHRMLIPRVRATLAMLLLPAWSLTVLLPALLWSWLDHTSFGVGLFALTLAMLGTILLTSIPPVLMAAIFLLAFVVKLMDWLGLWGPWDMASNDITGGLALLGLLVMIALCWWPLFRRGAPASIWWRPLAITLQTQVGSLFSTEQVRQQQTISWIGGNIPPEVALFADRPLQQMGVALGPGLGKPSWRSLLLGHLWLLLMVALWWPRHQPKVMDSSSLLLPCFMVAMVSAQGLTRVWQLFRRPELGLYELALLPGLPTGAARANGMLKLLLTRMGTGTLIAVAVMLVYGAARDAPPMFYSLVLGTGLTCVLINACFALWCAQRGGLHGVLLGTVVWLEMLVVLSADYGCFRTGHIPNGLLYGWIAVPLFAGAMLGGLRKALAQRLQPWISRA